MDWAQKIYVKKTKKNTKPETKDNESELKEITTSIQRLKGK